MTRGLALGFVSALAIMSAANAADINSGGFKDGPVYAPKFWTGIYVGMQSGAASGTAKVAYFTVPLSSGIRSRRPANSGVPYSVTTPR